MQAVKKNMNVRVGVVLILVGVGLLVAARFINILMPALTLLGLTSLMSAIQLPLSWANTILFCLGCALFGIFGWSARKAAQAHAIPAPWPFSQVITDFYLVLHYLFGTINLIVTQSVFKALALDPTDQAVYLTLRNLNTVSLCLLVIWLILQIIVTVNVVRSKAGISGFSVAIVILLSINCLHFFYSSPIFTAINTAFAEIGVPNAITMILLAIYNLLTGLLLGFVLILRALWARKQNRRFEQDMANAQLFGAPPQSQAAPGYAAYSE
ncbi:MAG: hypothetical protein LBG68_04920 [Coriobacteriales bacterium]|jgi:hypothetical protein|nr:hypothetical protein [Coriobacteriales bacterium]